MLSLAATLLLTMTVHAGLAAEATHVPATSQAVANANLIARADHALRDFSAEAGNLPALETSGRTRATSSCGANASSGPTIRRALH